MQNLSFLPSEIARLVLGYLSLEGYEESHRAFLTECPHLKEIKELSEKGKKCYTTIGGKTLQLILDEYATLDLLDTRWDASSLSDNEARHAERLLAELARLLHKDNTLYRPGGIASVPMILTPGGVRVRMPVNHSLASPRAPVTLQLTPNRSLPAPVTVQQIPSVRLVNITTPSATAELQPTPDLTPESTPNTSASQLDPSTVNGSAAATSLTIAGMVRSPLPTDHVFLRPKTPVKTSLIAEGHPQEFKSPRRKCPTTKRRSIPEKPLQLIAAAAAAEPEEDPTVLRCAERIAALLNNKHVVKSPLPAPPSDEPPHVIASNDDLDRILESNRPISPKMMSALIDNVYNDVELGEYFSEGKVMLPPVSRSSMQDLHTPPLLNTGDPSQSAGTSYLPDPSQVHTAMDISTNAPEPQPGTSGTKVTRRRSRTKGRISERRKKEQAVTFQQNHGIPETMPDEKADEKKKSKKRAPKPRKKDQIDDANAHVRMLFNSQEQGKSAAQLACSQALEAAGLITRTTPTPVPDTSPHMVPDTQGQKTQTQVNLEAMFSDNEFSSIPETQDMDLSLLSCTPEKSGFPPGEQIVSVTKASEYKTQSLASQEKDSPHDNKDNEGVQGGDLKGMRQSKRQAILKCREILEKKKPEKPASRSRRNSLHSPETNDNEQKAAKATTKRRSSSEGKKPRRVPLITPIDHPEESEDFKANSPFAQPTEAKQTKAKAGKVAKPKKEKRSKPPPVVYSSDIEEELAKKKLIKKKVPKKYTELDQEEEEKTESVVDGEQEEVVKPREHVVKKAKDTSVLKHLSDSDDETEPYVGGEDEDDDQTESYDVEDKLKQEARKETERQKQEAKKSQKEKHQPWIKSTVPVDEKEKDNRNFEVEVEVHTDSTKEAGKESEITKPVKEVQKERDETQTLKENTERKSHVKESTSHEAQRKGSSTRENDTTPAVQKDNQDKESSGSKDQNESADPPNEKPKKTAVIPPVQFLEDTCDQIIDAVSKQELPQETLLQSDEKEKEQEVETDDDGEKREGSKYKVSSGGVDSRDSVKDYQKDATESTNQLASQGDPMEEDESLNLTLEESHEDTEIVTPKQVIGTVTETLDTTSDSATKKKKKKKDKKKDHSKSDKKKKKEEERSLNTSKEFGKSAENGTSLAPEDDSQLTQDLSSSQKTEKTDTNTETVEEESCMYPLTQVPSSKKKKKKKDEKQKKDNKKEKLKEAIKKEKKKKRKNKGLISFSSELFTAESTPIADTQEPASSEDPDKSSKKHKKKKKRKSNEKDGSIAKSNSHETSPVAVETSSAASETIQIKQENNETLPENHMPVQSESPQENIKDVSKSSQAETVQETAEEVVTEKTTVTGTKSETKERPQESPKKTTEKEKSSTSIQQNAKEKTPQTESTVPRDEALSKSTSPQETPQTPRMSQLKGLDSSRSTPSAEERGDLSFTSLRRYFGKKEKTPGEQKSKSHPRSKDTSPDINKQNKSVVSKPDAVEPTNLVHTPAKTDNPIFPSDVEGSPIIPIQSSQTSTQNYADLLSHLAKQTLSSKKKKAPKPAKTAKKNEPEVALPGIRRSSLSSLLTASQLVEAQTEKTTNKDVGKENSTPKKRKKAHEEKKQAKKMRTASSSEVPSVVHLDSSHVENILDKLHTPT